MTDHASSITSGTILLLVPLQDSAAAALRPFLVGCPDNLGGGPWEDEGERHQGHWFFKACRLLLMWTCVDLQPDCMHL